MVEPRPAADRQMWMSIVSGINRYFPEVRSFEAFSSCIWTDQRGQSNRPAIACK